METFRGCTAELLETEKKAIDAISTFMLQGFNGRLAYHNANSAKSVEPVIDERTIAFWNLCFQSFEEYSQSLTFKSMREIVCYGNTDLDDGPDEDSDPEDLDEANVVMYTSLDEFKDYYKTDITREYLFNTLQRDDCDKLFEELCAAIENAGEQLSKRLEPKAPMLGRLRLTYLPQTLNLQDSAVCELLPYLLTAYTFNFWRSRFFYQDKPFLRLAFEARDINPIDAPKIRQKIKKLSAMFSLKQNIDDLITVPDQGHPSGNLDLRDENGKQQMDTAPYIRYESILRDVFDQWCTSILECIQRLNDSPLQVQAINFECCEALYNHYTNH